MGFKRGVLLALVAAILATKPSVASEIVYVLGPVSNEARATISRFPNVRSVRSVFEAGESAFLASEGISDLAGALRVELTDTESRDRFESEWSSRVQIDRNNVYETQEMHPDQWALNNRGLDQEIRTSDVDALRIRGKVGEDIGLQGFTLPPVGTAPISVAVVDSGIDLKHPDLQSAIRKTESECVAKEEYQRCLSTRTDKESCHRQFAQMDTDGNGYPLDCHGWNILGVIDRRTGIAGRNEPNDEVGHGTHVAGIIAANGRVQGAAAGYAKVIPVKVIGSERRETESVEDVPGPTDPEFTRFTTDADLFARGVLYSIRSGAQVINLSLGYNGRDDSLLMRRMIDLAIRRGILVVAASGNQSSRSPVYPCLYAGVVCVGSFSADGSISHFSNFGDGVDVAGPGHSILSTWLMQTRQFPVVHTERKGWDFKSGTSMAAPYVSSAFALLLAKGFSPLEAKGRLFAGARPSQAPTAMPDLSPRSTLFGNIDLGGAEQAVLRPLIVVSQKGPIILSWRERGIKKAEVSFPVQLLLRNIWGSSSSSVSVRLGTPVARDGLPGELRLSQQAYHFSSWAGGEEKTLDVTVRWNGSLDLSGEWILPITIVDSDGREERIEKSMEIVVPVSATHFPRVSREEEQGYRIRGLVLPASVRASFAQYTFKPIRCSIGVDRIFAFRSEGGILRFTFLDLDTGTKNYVASEPAQLSAATESLVGVDCLDIDGDGLSESVVMSVDQPARIFRFRYFSSTGSERESLKTEFSTDTTVPPREMSWLQVGTQKVPHWVSRGKLPLLDVPPFDPWDDLSSGGVAREEIRLYRAFPGGDLRIVPMPSAMRRSRRDTPVFVKILPETAEVLVYRGEGFLGEYSLVGMHPDGSINASREQPLRFESAYQHLALLRSVSVRDGSVAFWDISTLGRIRLFELVRESATWLSRVLSSPRPGDAASELISMTASSPSSGGAFFRTRYHLLFQDWNSGTVYFADPRMHEGTTAHLPAETSEGLPALVLPELRGASVASEVMVPRAAPGHEMSRPAGWRTIGTEGCELIDLQPTSGTALVRSLRYVCEDRVIEILL